MAENESGLEKNEKATPKRLADAKEEGNVARSREFNTMIVVLIGAIYLISLGESTLIDFANILQHYFTLQPSQLESSDSIVAAFFSAIKDFLFMGLPFFGVMLLAALMGFLIGGWSFSGKSISFDVKRINPIEGVKKIISVRGGVELVKGVLKIIFIGLVAYCLFRWITEDIFLLSKGSEKQNIMSGIQLVLWSGLLLCLPLFVIAAIDVPFQIWEHARKLKMTRQELKDEHKQTDGNPDVRGRIRSIQREMAQRRMMEKVPQADVVIVNPTHYAVALKYDEAKGQAPIVYAKGSDLIAQKIREIAKHHNVPIFSAPPLARAIFNSTEIDQEIPSSLYLSVAKILAYVFQIKIVRRYGGVMPEEPSDLPVPNELLNK